MSFRYGTLLGLTLGVVIGSHETPAIAAGEACVAVLGMLILRLVEKRAG